jgi:hypothetical protein
VTQIEDAMGIKKRIGFELIIETALGMQNIHEIAAASPRNESLHFGVADYAASTKAWTTNIGGPNARYGVLTDADGDKPRDFHWGDMWHYAISRLVVAARANGLRPVDGPFGDFSDPDGYRAQADRAGVLGCEGKWAIHPSQIALANEIYSPGKAEIEKARRIIRAMKEARPRRPTDRYRFDQTGRGDDPKGQANQGIGQGGCGQAEGRKDQGQTPRQGQVDRHPAVSADITTDRWGRAESAHSLDRGARCRLFSTLRNRLPNSKARSRNSAI